MLCLFRPTPKYSWERVDVYGNRFVLEDSKDGITFDDGDTRLLVIKLATRNHAGKYFCTATIGDKNHTVEGSLSFEGNQRKDGVRIEGSSLTEKSS